MKKSLFLIEKEYLQLADTIIENGGEVDETTENALAINRDELENKGRNYAYLIKDLENDVDTIDSEIARLKALKDSRSKVVERLKDTLKQAMELYDITEIKTSTLKINFRKSVSVEIDNIDLLENEYKTTKTTISADKNKIKDALKNGVVIIGATLKENNNLQIK